MSLVELEAVQIETEALRLKLIDLDDALTNVKVSGETIPVEVETAFANLEFNLSTIINWIDQAIIDGGGGQLSVIQQFLGELKVVFEKYSAIIEVVNADSGYGVDYGGGSSSAVKFTATLNGVSEVTTINKSQITSTDL